MNLSYRHLYFFVCNHIKQGELQVKYCPTDDMIGDFFTNPFQGAVFKQLHCMILNLAEDVQLPLTTTKPQEHVAPSSSEMYHGWALWDCQLRMVWQSTCWQSGPFTNRTFACIHIQNISQCLQPTSSKPHSFV